MKDWKIFIDTCSILHYASDKFWMNIIPLLRQHQKTVIVPFKCIEELKKHATNQDNLELAQKAIKCLKTVDRLISDKFLEMRGEKTDNFADNVFQVVFTKFRMQHKLILITQDNNLAKDINKLNENSSVKGYLVNVRRINKYGFLSKFNWNPEFEAERKVIQNRTLQKSVDVLSEDDAFQICTVVTNINDARLEVCHIPTEKETSYTSNGAIKLENRLAAGGEGTIYTTNTPYVAKIYTNKNITKRKYEKIKLMLSKSINFNGICYPVEVLYNSNKEFVGYLMPKAKGKELQKSLFIKPLFIKNFPNWKKRDTVELCITILEKIKYLHYRNIIMGDINPANILVVSSKEVYFVDTDSYQIEDFPCPVGTNNFTAPEIQRKHFSDFLRTIENENYAVATLLFMIMLPGKPPYSQQGGGDPIDNIIKMDFSYPFGDNSNNKTPDGPWRYMWSHLTYDLKKAFYNTFRKDGENAQEKNRLSVDEWLPIFKHYLKLLDSGKFGQQDKMSEELFPTRHKRNPNVTYTTCKLCGNEVAENQCTDGICRDCLKTGSVYRCKKCGKEILFTNYDKYIINAKRKDICRECSEYGKRVFMSQTCVDCGRTFEITNSEYEFFKSKGFDIPKRCHSCRGAKKNGAKSSFCFITTAVCDYLGKADDCGELTTLRYYRDTWLRNQPDGQALIAEYYSKAPLLVSKLNASENYDEYCQLLWTDYIQPCLQLIHEGEFEKCKTLYNEMLNHLSQLLYV